MSTTTCPGCATTVTLNSDGTIRAHRRGGVPCGPATGLTVGLPGWTRPRVTPNDRIHYQVKARRMAEMKAEARWSIRAARLPRMDRVHVTLHWRIPDRRVRDSDSLQLALKACLDALVAEDVITDDSWLYVPATSMRIHPPRQKIPAVMWLEIRELREDDQ